MKTVTLQIGNSDDKLTQANWHRFFENTASVVSMFAAQIHFCGCPASHFPWQNAAWVFEVEDSRVDRLKAALKEMRQTYAQESVAFTVGETQFV